MLIIAGRSAIPGGTRSAIVGVRIMDYQIPEIIAPRKPLMAFLDELSEKRLLYFYAPAGFGKTFTAQLWLKHRKMRPATLSLDGHDNSLVSFCRRLCALLCGCQPANQALHDIAGHPAFDSAPDEFTIRAVDALQNDVPTGLVVDDLHLIESDELLRLLPLIWARLPQSFILILLSRLGPPASFSNLVIKNTLGLVDARHLRLSAEEIRQFFRVDGQMLTRQQAEAVYHATEGWAFGVTALMLAGGQPTGQLQLQHQLNTLLKTHLWDKWPQDIQCFMLDTAYISALTPALCDVLTGRSDSQAMLTQLVEKNTFLSITGPQVYRFHRLFREFLHSMMGADADTARQHQQMMAGEWYLKNGDVYTAVEYLVNSGDPDAIARCFNTIHNYSVDFSVERLAGIVRHMGSAVAEKYPFMLATLGWSCFSEGDAAGLERFFDEYYARLPEISVKTPELYKNHLFFLCLDYRRSLIELTHSIQPGDIPVINDKSATTISQNMPCFHRSSRDFSEYTNPGMNEKVGFLRSSIGVIFGDEQYLLENCLKAGLLYEQGALLEAEKYALTANADIQPGVRPESKFCALMILAKILEALWRPEEYQKAINHAINMIEEDKAYYLSYNLSALIATHRMENGEDAATEWLAAHVSSPQDPLPVFKMCGHFASARAYIALGEYDNAIIFLKNLLHLCTTFRRPLDVIEARVLLAIAHWKKKRGFQKQALEYLEDAILEAHPYGYTQIFANEGSELTNMLYRLQSRSTRQDYTGAIPGSFVKTLYLQAMAQARHAPGLTAGQQRAPIKFTPQQKKVMLLLADGKSYREIAEDMGIKFSTVRSHMELIYKKLDVPNEAEAIRRIKELQPLDE